MKEKYIVKGPCRVGNSFGYPKELPSDKWAIVSNDEFNTGGYGPCQVFGTTTYDSYEEAVEANHKLLLHCNEGVCSYYSTATEVEACQKELRDSEPSTCPWNGLCAHQK